MYLIYHVLILVVGMTADYLESGLAAAPTTQCFSNKSYTVDNIQYKWYIRSGSWTSLQNI
jgi:hypothetical protein